MNAAPPRNAGGGAPARSAGGGGQSRNAGGGDAVVANAVVAIAAAAVATGNDRCCTVTLVFDWKAWSP